MTQIMELMDKRAKAWEAAKAFLNSHSQNGGMVSAEDAATYDKMEKEVTDLTKDIERLQRQEQIDKMMSAPTSTPLTGKPGVKDEPEDKPGRASAAYKKAFWDNIRHPGNPAIRDVLEEGTDANGGYLVPIEFEHTLVQALNENNIMRTIGCKVITTQNERKIPVANGHTQAAWTAENGAYTESNPTFAQTSIDAFNMGFSFNGTTSQSMGLATRITNEYRMPDLRNNTITMPGRHGVFDFGETVSERKILISCFIPPGKTDEQFLSKKDAIIEWLNPDNGLCQLILDKEPGRVYEARLTSGFSFDRAVRNSCTFDLEFFCPDPYGYAISDETFDFAETGTFTASRTLGNIESYPVYSLTGVIPSGTDSYISITTNGSELQIIGRLAAGETLIIDSDLMTAKVVDSNGETLRNGLPLLSELNFPVLNTGDNTIVIAVVGTSTTFTELNIQARSRWR